MPNQTKINLRLQQIQYQIDWLAAGFAAGNWDSIFLGRGFNFQGIVPFQDDPDLVRINWQASINSGDMQVNQFSEERNINLHLLAHMGPSIGFGSYITKQERLAQLAAVLAFSALRLKDNFRFRGYTDGLEHGFPEIRDKNYPLLLAKAILNFDWREKHRGGLAVAARYVPSPRSLVILVSDFLGDLSGTERALKIISTRHHILPLILWDEREVTLPGGFGFYPLRDMESGQLKHILLTTRSRQRFAENAKKRREAIEKLFRRFQIRPHFLIAGQTDDDISELVRIFIRARYKT